MTPRERPQPTLASRVNLLSAWIESEMAYGEIPGLAVGIVHDQELIWAQGFGYADREQRIPADAQTLFRVASITKLFTATAILQLRDSGRLQLDDPISRHIPWFGVRNPFPDAPTITIRHLLTHGSGLPREAAFPYWTETDFPAPEQIEAALAEQEVAVPPATRWKYSNLAFSLAGRIVEAVSQQDYADYLRDSVLRPLGMERTVPSPSDPEILGLAKGYGMRWPGSARQPAPFSDCRGIAPAAGIATSVQDLARFAMLQFRRENADGNPVLRGSTLAEMQRIHWLDPNWESGWGLGFSLFRRNGQTLFGHNGALHGFRSSLVLRASDKIAAILLINADGVDPSAAAFKVLDWVAPAVTNRQDKASATSVIDPAWHALIGKYRSNWGDQQVMVLDGALALIDPRAVDPLAEVVRLTPVGEYAFRMEATSGSRSPGEILRFDVDENGLVTRLWEGNDYAVPVIDW